VKPGASGSGERAGGLGSSPAVPDRTLVVATRLGDSDESVERLTLQQAASRPDFAQPHVVLCLASRPVAARKGWLAGWNGATGPWALPEDRYSHRDSQITKAEVRAQVVARLAPSPGSLVWDLGAGSGSVGIECARFGAAVVAVEQDAESCSRISANASAHGVEVAVVQSRAPEILSALPRPDAVFVGGGGIEVVRAALGFAPRRLVVALAAIERVGEVVALLRSDAHREVDGVLLQASRLTALPGAASPPPSEVPQPVHRFAAQNPIFVLWGDLR
jgi:precorrin-6Y C5,15-methyltransferase (decarboxylating)